MTAGKFLRLLAADRRGSFVIEMAIIAPILLTLAFGTFEIGTMVARQHQLQSAAGEAESIALAAAQGATVEIKTIRGILANSVNVPPENVVITRFYRCGDSATTVTNLDACAGKSPTGTPLIVSSYLKIDLHATYSPIWTEFGLGEPVRFDVERTVLLLS